MYWLRSKTIAIIILVGALVPHAAARADLQENLLIGLNLFDYQFNMQRNILGNGWDFTATAFYGGQTYHTGLADLTLSGASSTIFGSTRRKRTASRACTIVSRAG